MVPRGGDYAADEAQSRRHRLHKLWPGQVRSSWREFMHLLFCRKIQCILRRELIGDVYLLLCRKIQCILIGDMHRLPSTQIRVEFRVDYMR